MRVPALDLRGPLCGASSGRPRGCRRVSWQAPGRQATTSRAPRASPAGSSGSRAAGTVRGTPSSSAGGRRSPACRPSTRSAPGASRACVRTTGGTGSRGRGWPAAAPGCRSSAWWLLWSWSKSSALRVGWRPVRALSNSTWRATPRSLPRLCTPRRPRPRACHRLPVRLSCHRAGARAPRRGSRLRTTSRISWRASRPASGPWQSSRLAASRTQTPAGHPRWLCRPSTWSRPLVPTTRTLCAACPHPASSRRT
mmetsp:Transcript_53788/g.166658  ORF Transcript_53788/g.166658 Transcript_53788/m.166658 type:complete len:253 (-) Transcript_53788:316-1074(-)